MDGVRKPFNSMGYSFGILTALNVKIIAAYSGKRVSPFRRKLLPPSSEYRNFSSMKMEGASFVE
jgi:hypothetical protein